LFSAIYDYHDIYHHRLVTYKSGKVMFNSILRLLTLSLKGQHRGQR